MRDLTERREAIRADLMAHPERQGTAWYDDRVNEVHALTRSIRVREDTTDDNDDVCDIVASRQSDRDARELRAARIAIIAGLASAREWGSPLGVFHTS